MNAVGTRLRFLEDYRLPATAMDSPIKGTSITAQPVALNVAERSPISVLFSP